MYSPDEGDDEVESDVDNVDEVVADAPCGEERDNETGGRPRRRRHGNKRGASSSSNTKQTRSLHSCVVKLSVQSVTPNYSEPWRRRAQGSSSGTGFLVAGRKIVTNAHVVRRSTHVRARKSSSPVMFSCTVEWVSIPLDLAVLSVNDEKAFFNDAEEVSAGRETSGEDNELSLSPVLPRLDENVTCVGFPRGGQQISVTRGVVSRVDVNSYGVLRIQIDAAINPGNSGGPVFDEQRRVVGVASSHLKGGSNIGYIIPVEVLSHFLSMCKDGMEASAIERSALNVSNLDRTDQNFLFVGMEGPKMVPGVSGIGALMQSLESKALRRRLGLHDEHGGGVRISGLWSPSPRFVGNTEQKDVNKSETDKADAETGLDADEFDPLRVDDVLLSVDGIQLGQDGTIPLSDSRSYERIGHQVLITRNRVGETVNLGILRAGEPSTVQITLRPSRYLCPVYDSFDAHPSYVLCGGCVFVPLSWPWITAHKKQFGFPSFNSISSLPAMRNEQIIILSKVLADEVNVGYHHKKWLILKSVNGKRATNIRELVVLICDGCKEPNLEFRFFMICQEHNEQIICMDTEECIQSESRIMKQHMIASWCSDDAIPVAWRGLNTETMFSLLDDIRK